MKKELSKNDIKYPILSILFDGPEELVARAEALQNSIAHDIIDSSQPRLRQLEIISELLRTHNTNNYIHYQQALHRVSLANLRQLLED